ncbi:nucleotidyltransferase family protein [Staphylococcus aureus]|nr:nucleotidyltransferase family protein [Staphylococcus aureus]WRN72724.1 nucleotidyltransferase family protein [Staphylococcus aureus]
MKSVGLITEYNPFHNGHQYHINQSKKLTNADVTIAIMSGNFVMRGEPAIYNEVYSCKNGIINS